MNNIDPVEFVEEYFGVELMGYQKTMLRNTLNQKEIYICYPRHCGYSEYKEMLWIMKNLRGDINNDGDN